jgi:uncharacterized protein (TIGR03086 family)
MSDPVRTLKSVPVSNLAPAAEQIKALLAGVDDDQLPLPTPCPSWTVGDLLDHLMTLTVAFHNAATRSPGDGRGPGDASAANLDPDWRRQLPARLDALVAAWQDPGAWTGLAEAGGVTLPADVTGTFGLNELVMHGWDLAKATGQPFACDPDNAAAVFALLTGMTAAGAGAGGGFGTVVPVPPDAPLLDRAVGLAGRDPRWKP